MTIRFKITYMSKTSFVVDIKLATKWLYRYRILKNTRPIMKSISTISSTTLHTLMKLQNKFQLYIEDIVHKMTTSTSISTLKSFKLTIYRRYLTQNGDILSNSDIYNCIKTNITLSLKMTIWTLILTLMNFSITMRRTFKWWYMYLGIVKWYNCHCLYRQI